jgi:DNA-directed RNA polymerase specialized sigma24 family protein
VHTAAVPTLRKLIMKGTVWGLYHELGGQGSSDLRIPIGGVDREDAYDLAAETVLGALPVLRHQLLAGRWSADGGASVVTWSVNLTILRLPGPWRAWRKTRVLRLPDRFTETERDRDEQPEAIVYSVEFERHVELLDDDLLEAVLRLDCNGLSDAEIAKELGRTVKSVEYRLGVARQRVRDQARRERDRGARRGVA